jgi:glucose 1-dehydrogenase
LGGTCRAFTADARDDRAIADIVQKGWDEFGAIHHLFNLVGGSRSGEWHRAENYPLDVFDRVIEFNLRPHFLSCREVGRRMIENGIAGSIVNFASIAGTFTLPYQIGYGMGKAAVINMTRTLAVEWGPHQIRVNAIAPGGGISRERPRLHDSGEVQERPDLEPSTTVNSPGSRNPLGRGLDSSELAAVALFLASDLASGVTGQTITVDAGVTSRMPSGDLEYWAHFLEPN